jgi:hypothetical protein
MPKPLERSISGLLLGFRQGIMLFFAGIPPANVSSDGEQRCTMIDYSGDNILSMRTQSYEGEES